MYYSPFFIKRYKTSASKHCIDSSICGKTLYRYDCNGYPKKSNPNNLVCRNEVDGTIYLRDKPNYSRITGGVTAVKAKKDNKSDKTVVTTIAYHDTGGTMWFLLFTIAGTIFLINQTESIWALITPLVVLSISFGLLHSSQHKKQKEWIELVIKNCEIDQL